MLGHGYVYYPHFIPKEIEVCTVTLLCVSVQILSQGPSVQTLMLLTDHSK